MLVSKRKGTGMASSADLWYIRLPDGRVLRARSTEALRQYLKAGRVPWESRVRRSAEEPWQTLDRSEEFADLAPAEEASPSEPAAPTKTRVGGPELRTLGVRGLVEELFNAFDSSLQRTKLTVAALTGLGIGVVLVIANVADPLLAREWKWAGYLGIAFVLLVLFSICTSILTQMTALELSRYRPARFSEIRAGLLGYAVRLTCALSLIGGSIVGMIVLLRCLPGWIAPGAPQEPGLALETLLNVVNGTRLLLEVIGWPILMLAMLLMGPILIVEDLSIWQGLREWLGMLRQHLGRIYLYQALAFAFAAVMTLPLVAPILLASGFVSGNPHTLSLGESVPFFLLVGIALTPTLAYLLVAHVFIYLNLRYEFFYSTRER
jgi:hypothetical protein